MEIASASVSEHVSSGAVERDHNGQERAVRSKQISDRNGDHESRDRFTPSSTEGEGHSAQNGGTYQVTRTDFFASANFFLLQTGSSPASQPTSSAILPAAPSPTTGTNVPAASGAAAVPNSAATPSSNDPLQALNSALATLGLSQQDIQAFDQIANFIKAFSQVAFADLVSQFQNLAQQSSLAAALLPSPVNPVGTPTTGGTATPTASGSPATNGSSPASGTSSAGSFQIEELSIRFSGVDAQGSSTSTAIGSNGGSGANFQFSAFNLQIEEIKVTLTDQSGQTALLQTPHPA